MRLALALAAAAALLLFSPTAARAAAAAAETATTDAPRRLPEGAAGLSGEAIMATVNAAAAAAASSPAPAPPSRCDAGFDDVDALAAAVAGDPPRDDDDDDDVVPRVDWTEYDDAYAAAPLALPESYLVPPEDGCTYGALPQGSERASRVQRAAAVLPWRGKCFRRAAEDETVSHPTGADRKRLPDDAPPVKLLARVTNRVQDAAPTPTTTGGSDAASVVEQGVATETDETASDKNQTDTENQKENRPRERRVAPANVYVGASTFDGLPAVIVDYAGQEYFGSFRDEMRHVGCGVWLGKTYLTGEPKNLAKSLASVGGVELTPILTGIIAGAMPKIEPGDAPPHVLDFVVFQTTDGGEGEEA